MGHSLKVEIEVGPRGKVRLGGRLFDLVDAVESWQLSDPEVGLSSFVLHRDFRDYYNKHGGVLVADVTTGRHSSVGISYSDQRWAARSTRDPWTLLRNDQRWRDNPAMDEGTMHLLNTTLRYDSRNDPENPWTGWFLVADYEFGTGTIHRYGATSPGVRDRSPTGETTYDRLFVDLRRYNRISPDGQLNFRLVAGGWLSGDDLPLQRRFSLGGPGSMAGYDFRRSNDESNVLQCSTPSTAGTTTGPRGRPAQCERFAMAQVEFRGDVHVDPFGVLDGERDSRRAGWGRGTQWVLFADAGRGWLVGPSDGELFYGKGALPSLSTFRLDVGLGLVLDNIGIYAAKGVNGRSAPINVFVRLQPRF
ncbi:MAG: BamA/TamA family outer membrane protein [Gemmatimonadaceae bacterium]